ncbi:MAG TPA: aromatic-ring-hydroxylating dioxygenase subunit beta [Alphaproteobacteria bacterium]|nr:aromatic-ring-hydroxylating dioxygenase subunit beta [Alphaproteobacteria bacterium]
MSALSPEERAEVEAFVYREARLADESAYAEWEALLADDMHYWVPQGRADYDPASRISFINDNRSRLDTRLRQLRTGLRHAQTPPSPMRRVISNLEIERLEDGYAAAGNFVLYEHAVQANNSLRIWAGRVTYGLRHGEDGLRMYRKVVELVNAGGPLPSLAFLI